MLEQHLDQDQRLFDLAVLGRFLLQLFEQVLHDHLAPLGVEAGLGDVDEGRPRWEGLVVGGEGVQLALELRLGEEVLAG